MSLSNGHPGNIYDEAKIGKNNCRRWTQDLDAEQLLDLLLVYGDAFVSIVQFLELESRNPASGVAIWFDSRDHKNLLCNNSSALNHYFKLWGLIVSEKQVADLIAMRSRGISLKEQHYQNLLQTFRNEMSARVFLSVSPSRESIYANPLSGWESIIQAFPEVQEDVEEMQKCFALSRYTASVFHSL